MARRYNYEVSAVQTYTSGGPISINLSSIPGTITSIDVKVESQVTTGTTPGQYMDADDRLIQSMTIADGGHTYCAFSDLRTPYHMSRLALGGAAPRRQAITAPSQTNAQRDFFYRFHFGVAPWKLRTGTPRIQLPALPKSYDAASVQSALQIGIEEQIRNLIATRQIYYDPWDLTAGITNEQRSSLTLTGQFNPNTAEGSGTTVEAATIRVYANVVEQEAGDKPSDYTPLAIPKWSMLNPQITATSTSPNSQTIEVPGGEILYAIYLMATLGATSPRSDAMLGSLGLQWVGARTIWTYREADSASMLSQMQWDGWPPSADPNAADAVSPAISQVVDPGLYMFPAYKAANGPGASIFGAPLPTAAGQLLITYNVNSVTGGAALSVLTQKYEMH